jgi:hypothetical protein
LGARKKAFSDADPEILDRGVSTVNSGELMAISLHPGGQERREISEKCWPTAGQTGRTCNFLFLSTDFPSAEVLLLLLLLPLLLLLYYYLNNYWFSYNYAWNSLKLNTLRNGVIFVRYLKGSSTMVLFLCRTL